MQTASSASGAGSSAAASSPGAKSVGGGSGKLHPLALKIPLPKRVGDAIADQDHMALHSMTQTVVDALLKHPEHAPSLYNVLTTKKARS